MNKHKSLNVLLNDSLVGKLAITKENLVAFEYN
jgi:hypothetical protein